jgi:hypothetical protein
MGGEVVDDSWILRQQVALDLEMEMNRPVLF